MQLTFNDKILLSNTDKKYAVFELFDGQRYRMYLTDNPPGTYGGYPRHVMKRAAVLPADKARMQINLFNEIKI